MEPSGLRWTRGIPIMAQDNRDTHENNPANHTGTESFLARRATIGDVIEDQVTVEGERAMAGQGQAHRYVLPRVT